MDYEMMLTVIIANNQVKQFVKTGFQPLAKSRA